MKEMSGRYSDGGIEPKFCFSIGNPLNKGKLKLTFTPLSKYDPSRLRQPPVTIQWESNNGNKGKFHLLENGQSQTIMISSGQATKRGFILFRSQADYSGQQIEGGGDLPSRRIIGFLDKVEVQD